MIVWCNLDKREVLSEVDCYYCETRIGKIEYCLYLMNSGDALKKDFEKYHKDYYIHNVRKNKEYISKADVLEIIEKQNNRIVDINDAVAKSCVLSDINKLKVYKGIKKSDIIKECFKGKRL